MEPQNQQSQSQSNSKEKGLKSSTVALMISTALFFDALQWLLAFIVMDWLAGFFAFMTFYVWFKIHGMNFMTPKRLATMGGTFIIEIAPILSILPAWTGAVVILVLDYKAKKTLAALGQSPTPAAQKGPPLPKQPRRPTMNDWRYARDITNQE